MGRTSAGGGRGVGGTVGGRRQADGVGRRRRDVDRWIEIGATVSV